MEEFLRWKATWRRRSEDATEIDSLAKAINYDRDSYPNLFILLKIACTTGVTSCECERSGSVLKRLNTYLRASMTQERRSGLAFLHIHQEVKIDVEDVINLFALRKTEDWSFYNGVNRL